MAVRASEVASKASRTGVPPVRVRPSSWSGITELKIYTESALKVLGTHFILALNERDSVKLIALSLFFSSGMTDLKVISDTKGYCVYKDHLPYLGDNAAEASQGSQFQSRDLVVIDLDLDTVKSLQEGHGSWTDDMLESLTMTGRVVSLVDNGDVIVVYPSGKSWTFNPACLTKVTTGQNGSNLNANYDNVNAKLTSANDAATLSSNDDNAFNVCFASTSGASCSQLAINLLPNNSAHLGSGELCSSVVASTSQYGAFGGQQLIGGQQFVVGDLVRICSNLERIKRLQLNHGEWSDGMIETLGKVGRIAEIYHDNDLKVEVCGNSWTYNPLAVVKIGSTGGFNHGELF